MDFRLTGVVVPLLTPLDELDRLDVAALQRLVDFLISRGVSGLFSGGTTGEFPSLSFQERVDLARATVHAADGRVPVVVHAGMNTTTETIRLALASAEAGAQAAAVITPYYYHFSEQALIEHFRAVAAALPDFPIYLYNNPQFTGNNITPSMVRRVVELCPNVIGMKDSSGILTTLSASMELRGGKFNTLSGPDWLILAGQAFGFDGCVSGSTNVIPELTVALYQAAHSQNWERARALQKRVDTARVLLGEGRDLSLYKGVLAERGIAVGKMRLPYPNTPVEIAKERWVKLEPLLRLDE
ncbi:MAG TPA: dihydrodipicolinate synthase family protein [Anaerolineaceae bacterium]